MSKCRSEFLAYMREQFNSMLTDEDICNDHEFSNLWQAWQAAWNRSPSPEVAKAREEGRKCGIEEAAGYHTLLAEFYDGEANQQRREGFLGSEERERKHANRHRVYAKEILAEVWKEEQALAETEGEK